MDVVKHSRQSWNHQSTEGSRWTTPVSSEVIQKARIDDWELILTPNRPVPREWFGELQGRDVLCLASGGGQQVPILAATGANVTSFDNSEVQLEKDGLVARREGLEIRLVQGDMADLSTFEDGSFDLIFHPVSNVFVQDVIPVWKECSRVLRSRGRLLAGFMNPAFFLFDHEELGNGLPPVVRYRLPFADTEDLSEERRRKLIEEKVAFEFSHSLQSQIGGQIAAGFAITGFYEDNWSNEATPLNKYMDTYVATKADKI